MRPWRMTALLPAILAISALTLCAAPRIAYTKSFKGSTPAFVSIVVERDGKSLYKEAEDDPSPVTFELTPADTELIFSLAAKLDNFGRPLESGLKVAFMGTKTFRFEDGAAKRETSFNYSEDLNAQQLAEFFDRIIETEQRFFELDRTVHFDKLGINNALVQITISWDRKRLVSPLQFLPLLNRISRIESIMHIARERAAMLAEAFQKGPEEKASQ